MNIWIAGKYLMKHHHHLKKNFYSELNLEYYRWRLWACPKVWKVFGIKNLGEDLYVQSDTLLLPDVFENFRDKCIEIYELDPANFLSAPGLAWQACLKKDKREIRIIDRYWYPIDDWKRH